MGGLRDECVRIYRKNERLKEKNRKSSYLQNIVTMKRYAMKYFGKDAIYEFIKFNLSDAILINSEALLFVCYRRNSDYIIQLVSKCQYCGKLQLICYLCLTHHTELDVQSKIRIGENIIKKNYNPVFTCKDCQNLKESQCEQEAS